MDTCESTLLPKLLNVHIQQNNESGANPKAGHELALKLAQSIITQRAQLHDIVSEQCAHDIDLVWTEVQAIAKRRPTATDSIIQWQDQICNEVEIDRYLQLASTTRAHAVKSSESINSNWGIPATLALPEQILVPK